MLHQELLGLGIVFYIRSYKRLLGEMEREKGNEDKKIKEKSYLKRG